MECPGNAKMTGHRQRFVSELANLVGRIMNVGNLRKLMRIGVGSSSGWDRHANYAVFCSIVVDMFKTFQHFGIDPDFNYRCLSPKNNKEIDPDEKLLRDSIIQKVLLVRSMIVKELKNEGF
jgi:hypothetical protein